jgi:hypothetical protein
MKAVTIILFLLLVFPGTLKTAHANEIGIGLATPVPTGITLKLWFDKTNAFDIVGSWNINDDKYYIHADYLTHDFSKFAVEPAAMASYYGIGVRIKEEDEKDADTHLGMRIPFGLAYYPESVPFEIFGEVAPRLDITPSTDFGLDVMIGIRYRINPNK